MATLDGAWSGQGLIQMLTGVERAACTATYRSANAATTLALMCTTDHYRLDLLTLVTERRGALSGTWSERSFGTSGSVVGRRDGNRLRLAANVAGAQVNLLIVTEAGRQTVSLKTTSPLVAGGSLVLARLRSG